MSLRAATDADRDALAKLHLASWRDAYTDVFSPEYLRHGAAAYMEHKWSKQPLAGEVFVVEDPDLVVFIALEARESYAFVENLLVAPEARSGGIGGALMISAFAWAQCNGYSALKLIVLEATTRGRAFYTRMGGVEEATRIFDPEIAPPVASPPKKSFSSMGAPSLARAPYFPGRTAPYAPNTLGLSAQSEA